MTTYIVLLRGINVGGTRSLSMAALRSVCEALGCADVRTYIQSGNVVLRSALDGSALSAALEGAIQEHAGFAVPVVLLTVDELQAIVERLPFDPESDPTTLVLWVCATPFGPTGLDGVNLDAFGDERVVREGRVLYLLLPQGQGRSRLVQALGTAFTRTASGADMTARNWRTVLTLLDMAGGTRTTGCGD